MAYRSGGFSREGLNVRAGQSDSAQISIELGQGYDLDSEIEGLRSDVGRLKQTSMAIGEENKLQTQAAETLLDHMRQAGVALKKGKMSMAIGEENKLQKQAAETLSEYMEQAQVALNKGMRRVNKALRQSKSNHLLYLALFCLAIFFLLYFLIRSYKLITWRH